MRCATGRAQRRAELVNRHVAKGVTHEDEAAKNCPEGRSHSDSDIEVHPGVSERLAEQCFKVLMGGVVLFVVETFQSGSIAVVKGEEPAIFEHEVDKAVDEVIQLPTSEDEDSMDFRSDSL